MPVFGNRMVVGTANVKHIAKVKKETDERETRLAKWMREKEERKKNLNILHEKIRTNSITSNDSRAPPPPYLPEDANLSASRRGSSVSRKSSSASWKGPDNLNQKGRSFSDVTLSPVSVPDTTEIVGGGRKRESVCANCTIQWTPSTTGFDSTHSTKLYRYKISIWTTLVHCLPPIRRMTSTSLPLDVGALSAERAAQIVGKCSRTLTRKGKVFTQ